MSRHAFSDIEFDGRARIPRSSWQALHFRLVAAFVLLTQAITLWDNSEAMVLAVLIWSSIALAAALLNRLLQPAIVDTLGQLDVRARFFLFLLHFGVMGVPLLIGVRGWTHAFCAVLAFQLLLCWNKFSFGRISAFATLCVVIRFFHAEIPPLGLTAGWFALLLLVVRVEYVRYRLETFAGVVGLPLRDAARESAAALLLPLLVAVGVAGGVQMLFPTARRSLSLEAGLQPGAELPTYGDSSFSMLLDGLILLGMIVGLLLFLQWIERRFRRKGADVPMGDEELTAFGALHTPAAPGDESLHEKPEADDPRGRILRRFRGFVRTLDKLGLVRSESETAGEFLRRVTPHGVSVPAAYAPFDQACYDDGQPTEQEAAEFLKSMDELETRVRESGMPPTDG